MELKKNLKIKSKIDMTLTARGKIKVIIHLYLFSVESCYIYI